MDILELNTALNKLGYLMHILPALLEDEDASEYIEAYNTITNNIKTYQECIDDDWK